MSDFKVVKLLDPITVVIGVNEHDELIGLNDDDHLQYHNDDRGDFRYYLKSEVNDALDLKEDVSEKGAANGYCPLDGFTKVPAIYLPSYVDDVLEYANLSAFPVTGEAEKIYIALDNNKTYRWSGSIYVEVSPSDVNSVFGRTGIVAAQSGDYNTSQVTENTNLYFTNARARLALSGLTPVSYNNSTGEFSMAVATGSVDGYLSAANFTTFNNKLGNGLSSARIFVGSASNIATPVVMSGDVAISNVGATTIQPNVVTNSKLRQGTQLSVIGRASNTLGDVADISASASGQVLTRAGSTLLFSYLDASTIQSGVFPIVRGGTNSGNALSGNKKTMVTNGNAIIENPNPLVFTKLLTADANGYPISTVYSLAEVISLIPVSVEAGHNTSVSGFLPSIIINDNRENYYQIRTSDDFNNLGWVSGADILIPAKAVVEINNIEAAIDISDISCDRFILQGDAVIIGHGLYKSGLHCSSGTSVMFECASYSLKISGVNLRYKNGTMFSTDNGIEPQFFTLDSCIIDEVDRLGTIRAAGVIKIHNCDITNVKTSGFLFTKTIRRIEFVNNRIYKNASVSCITYDTGADVRSTLIEGNVFYENTSGVFYIESYDNRFKEGIIISNNSTPTSELFFNGFTQKEDKVISRSNYGIKNSSVSGQIYFDSNTTATTFSALSTPVILNGLTSGSFEKCTVDGASGRITISPSIPSRVIISFSGDCTSSGTNQNYIFRVYKNGTQILEDGKRRVRTDNVSDYETISLTTSDENPVAGDYYEMWVENITSTSSVTIRNATFLIRE